MSIEIHAVAFTRRLSDLIDAGYPHAWRVSDNASGTTPGSRIREWEDWCEDQALEFAEYAVIAYRRAKKRAMNARKREE